MTSFDNRPSPASGPEVKEALSLPQAPGTSIEISAAELNPGQNKFGRSVTIQGTPQPGTDISAPNIAINNPETIKDCSLTASSGGKFKIGGINFDVSPISSGQISISGDVADSRLVGAKVEARNISASDITAAEVKADNIKSQSSVVAATVKANSIDPDCDVIAHKISTADKDGKIA